MEHIFQSFDPEIKKSLIAMLIALSEADNEYAEYEIALIKDTGLKMGLTLDDIKYIKKNLSGYKLILPDNLSERMKIFCYLIFMIRIDGKITISEKELIKKVGFRLCLNPPLMNEIFEILEKYLNKQLPDTLIADMVKKYMN